MATFDDITGWREELDILRESDVFKEIYSREKLSAIPPKIPLSVMSTYAESLLKNGETRAALETLNEWQKRQPDAFVDTDADPTFPHREQQLLTDFEVWFSLKSGFGPNDWAYIHDGGHFARAVLNGVWPAVRCREAIDYVEKNASARIDATA